MMKGLKVDAQWDVDGCRMALVGEARLETIHHFDEIATLVDAREVQNVLLDLSGLEFMDSASTGSILRMHLHLAARDGALVMHSLPRMIQRLFARLGLNQFVIVDDEAAALAHIAQA